MMRHVFRMGAAGGRNRSLNDELDRPPGAEQDFATMERTRRRGFWVVLAAAIIRPLSVLLTRRRWSGQQHIPTSGPVILAANHVSSVDPPLLAHFVYASGRNPRFLAKSELWRVPLLRRVLTGAGQIPVYRHDSNAQEALRDAVAALRAGHALVIYPEGTITQEPDYWPMRARTGVARLALATGAPVVPVAQWGAQRIWGRDRRLRLLGRPEIRIAAGPPVDQSRFVGAPGSPGERPPVVPGRPVQGFVSEQTAEMLREVTQAVMADLTAMVEVIRGERAPERVGRISYPPDTDVDRPDTDTDGLDTPDTPERPERPAPSEDALDETLDEASDDPGGLDTSPGSPKGAARTSWRRRSPEGRSA